MQFKRVVFQCLLAFMVFFTIDNLRCTQLTQIKGCVFGAETIVRYVYIDDSFNDWQVKLIKEAMVEWEQKTHHQVLFINYTGFNIKAKHLNLEGNSNNLLIKKVSKDDAEVREIEKDRNTIIIGFYNGTSAIHTILLIYDRGAMLYDPDYFRSTAIHELGHAINIDHTKVENTIMYPTMDKSSNHLSPEDIRIFCKEYYCK